MGIIRNTYVKDSENDISVPESYNSNCVIVMESLWERLGPPPPPTGCGPKCYSSSNWSTDSPRYPRCAAGRRRGNKSVIHSTNRHHHLHHESGHSRGQPEPDTGQPEGLQHRESEKQTCRRFFCPKCRTSVCWTKSRMLRIAGHCILFLLLASCGGYIVNANFGHGDSLSDIADIIESPHLKGIHLQPVLLSDLKQQLKQTRNYHDFLRIFLSKKDVPNEIIDDLINGKAIRDILGANQEKRRSYESEGVEGGSEEEEYDMMQMDEEGERLDEELAAGWYHTEEMEESPLGECKTPRPEIVNVYDEEGKNRIYLPQCTVVHRCRNVSGCCGSANSECGPKYVKVIERTFIVIHKFGDDKATLNDEMVVRKLFVNHTECECKEKKVLPNCDKYKCPFPFSMRRTGINCTCECPESVNEINFLCNSYKNGEIQLQETDLECIKCEKCLKPLCTAGTFDVASGFCPKPESWRVWNPFEKLLSNEHLSPNAGRGRHFSVRSNSDPEPERSRVQENKEMNTHSPHQRRLDQERQILTSTRRPEQQTRRSEHREKDQQPQRQHERGTGHSDMTAERGHVETEREDHVKKLEPVESGRTHGHEKKGHAKGDIRPSAAPRRHHLGAIRTDETETGHLQETRKDHPEGRTSHSQDRRKGHSGHTNHGSETRGDSESKQSGSVENINDNKKGNTGSQMEHREGVQADAGRRHVDTEKHTPRRHTRQHRGRHSRHYHTDKK